MRNYLENKLSHYTVCYTKCKYVIDVVQRFYTVLQGTSCEYNSTSTLCPHAIYPFGTVNYISQLNVCTLALEFLLQLTILYSCSSQSRHLFLLKRLLKNNLHNWITSYHHYEKVSWTE